MMKVSIARRRLEQRSVSSFTDAELRARKRESGLLGKSEVSRIGSGKSFDTGTRLTFPLTPAQNETLESIFDDISHHANHLPASLRRDSNYFVLTLSPEKTSPPSHSPKFITAKEVAVILSVSRNSIYRQVKSGRIQAVRVGRALRFDFEKVLELLSSGVEPRSKSEGSDSED